MANYLHEIKFQDIYNNSYKTTLESKHIIHIADIKRLEELLLEVLPNNKVRKHTLEIHIKEE